MLREGQPFSAALEQQPAVFSPLYVATVRAAEKTSDLAPALSRYVAYQAQLEAIRKRALNASIYPMILIAAGALVSCSCSSTWCRASARSTRTASPICRSSHSC